jgi:NTP pyrophosphatase (non-canonical NTP hydrolase)
MKLAEEYGEFVQAYLSTTSSTNKKGLTWDDVREEICDVVIVAIDILLTKLPNELELPDEQFKKMISKIIEMKLDKWIMNSITKEKQATM